MPKAFAALTRQALAEASDRNIDETAGPRRRDQTDTCTPGEKNGIKRIQPITQEQATAPDRFIRLADEISLTQPTQQIDACKDSGMWPAHLVAEIWQDLSPGRSNLGYVGGYQPDFEAGRRRQSLS